MILTVNKYITLKSISTEDADEFYLLIDKNRLYLSKCLPWVSKTNHVNDTKKYIESKMSAYENGHDYTFCILYKKNEKESIIGSISLQKINKESKRAEIGYWLSEDKQGLGIITKSCKRLLSYAFSSLKLEIINILCSTNNLKSMAIPLRLKFLKANTELLVNENGTSYIGSIFLMSSIEWKKLEEYEFGKKKSQIN